MFLHTKILSLHNNEPKRNKPELKVADVIKKFQMTPRYLDNNFMVGLPRTLHVPIANETGLKLSNIGVERYFHSYNSMTTLLFLTVVGNRSMIMYGDPGLGKTYAGLLMTKVAGIPKEEMFDGFIVGNTEQGQDIFGIPDIEKMLNGKYEINPTKFIQANIKFIDETSRFSGFAQGLLLSAISEKKAYVQAEGLDVAEGPMIFAANALNSGETFGIIPALRSRIDIADLAIDREMFFSGIFQQPLKFNQYDTVMQFKPEEFSLLRRVIDDIEIPRSVHQQVLYFIQKLRDIPFGLLSGEAQSKAAFYGNFEQTARGYMGNMATNEKADLEAVSLYHFNNGFSDRERQTLEWYSKALALMSSLPNSKTKVTDVHFKALFPYVAYRQLTLNSMSAKANQDRPVLNEFNYFKKFAKDLWEKVEKDLSIGTGATAFADINDFENNIHVEDFEKRLGIYDIAPVDNILLLTNKIEEILGTGTITDAISLVVSSLKHWDSELSVKSDRYSQMVISGLKVLDYLIDQLEGNLS